ncbi:MAG TPA: glycosyltransferase family 4 protein [Candidatus Binataceae bacterium]|nr:glycosyltransferase family 4 protein [Candidatus Binataceae bacterium]
MAHILFIAYTTYVHDGRVKRHAEALAERGDRVDVLCLDSGHNGVLRGVNVIGLKMPRYRGASRCAYALSYLRFFVKASAAALRFSLARRYDIVVVCTMPDAAVLCALPARLFGSRIVLDIHDTMPELYRDKFGGRRGAIGARLLMLEERASARCADRVLAVHALHRARLVRAGVPARKIKTVMNAPDPAFFGAAAKRRAHANGAFTLACHGTLAPRLGLDTAIEALALVRPRIPELRMKVIGVGDYLEQAEQLTLHRNLGGCVSFIDQVPVEELPSLLAEADVGLVPNRASSATHLMLPVKLLDYAALGIPAIVARLRTIEHYFDEDSVRFFEPGDARGLAAAIEELHSDRERRAALARNARRALGRIAWPIQRIEYYHAIDSLLAQAQPGPCRDPERGVQSNANN